MSCALFSQTEIEYSLAISEKNSSRTRLGMSSVYHPQTKVQPEVTNRATLTLLCLSELKKLEGYLSWAEYWYNTTFHASTKYTPFELVYGQAPPLLVNYTEGNFN